MMPGNPRTHAPRHRGVAILIAISVLAILTILVMALGYSLDSSQHAQGAESAKVRGERLARAGFDYAIAMLGRIPGSLTEPREVDLALSEGECHIAARRAQAGESFYGSFVHLRPGDVVLTVTASLRKGRPMLQVTQTYLVNLSPAFPRRLLCQESVPKSLPPRPQAQGQERKP